MNLLTVILIILLIAVVGGLPAWNLHPYGYWPSTGVGLVLTILIILLLLRAI